jgi:hypothetical protein
LSCKAALQARRNSRKSRADICVEGIAHEWPGSRAGVLNGCANGAAVYEQRPLWVGTPDRLDAIGIDAPPGRVPGGGVGLSVAELTGRALTK